MSKELYRVKYDRSFYHSPVPGGHDTQGVREAREILIQEHLYCYLAEILLGTKFAEFSYTVGSDPVTGERYFASLEPGPARKFLLNAIVARQKEDIVAQREITEYVGFRRLEQQLLSSAPGTIFVWVSPPIEEGHHSITFIGQLLEDENTRNERVRVIIYRNDHSLDEHRKYLQALGHTTNGFLNDFNFIAHPLILRPTDDIERPEDILAVIGEREPFNQETRKRLEEDRTLGALIQGYLLLVKEGASDEELKNAFHVIEDYVSSKS